MDTTHEVGALELCAAKMMHHGNTSHEEVRVAVSIADKMDSKVIKQQTDRIERRNRFIYSADFNVPLSVEQVDRKSARTQK